MALTAVLDHNGVAINVGDTVKLQGTVIAVNNADRHFKEVEIQLSYPLTAQANGGVPCPELNGFATTVHGSGTQHYPGADQLIKCSGLTLTH